MSTTQKTPKASIFVDFIPAELRENKTWEIVYYVLNPFTDKLQIKRNRVRPLKSVTERRKLAKRMIQKINSKLERGWNPFIEEGATKSFAKLFDVCDEFIKKTEIEYKKGQKRADTLRSYYSFLKNLKQYLKDSGREKCFVIDFNYDLILEFLEYKYYKMDVSARTYNNYLSFFNTFSEYLLKRRYISKNPCSSIDTLAEETKKRVYIDKKYRDTIFEYYNSTNSNFYTVCLACYYCLIRRTELTKLKVGDVILRNSIIYIDSGNSKNRTSKPVTIPDPLMKHLINHLNKANNDMYLFSGDNFKPGYIQLSPKKISDLWSRMRTKTGIPKNIQWYSLKDTGITDLLLNGMELIRVKDQARHHSITQTEDYIPKQILKADERIKNSGLRFKN